MQKFGTFYSSTFNQKEKCWRNTRSSSNSSSSFLHKKKSADLKLLFFSDEQHNITVFFAKVNSNRHDIMQSSSIPSMTTSENSEESSSSSNEMFLSKGMSRKMSSPHLTENIMRKIERDPFEVYEYAKVLGTGSMVSY